MGSVLKSQTARAINSSVERNCCDGLRAFAYSRTA